MVELIEPLILYSSYRIYCRLQVSARPTVKSNYRRAQECCFAKLCLRSPPPGSLGKASGISLFQLLRRGLNVNRQQWMRRRGWHELNACVLSAYAAKEGRARSAVYTCCAKPLSSGPMRQAFTFPPDNSGFPL